MHEFPRHAAPSRPDSARGTYLAGTDGTSNRGVWLLLLSMLAFKIGSVATVLAIAGTDRGEVNAFLAIASWYWLPVTGAILAGPLLIAYRSLREREREYRRSLLSGPQPLEGAVRGR